MRLTQKLVNWLYRAINRSPDPALAFRINHGGVGATLVWTVQDNVLTTTITGGSGSNHTYDLTAHTIGTLSALIESQPGYTCPFVTDDPAVFNLAASALIDGSGNQDESNGDHLYVYRSAVWAYLEPLAVELDLARKQLDQQVLQMNVRTAADKWLDELGMYYAVDRDGGENDATYAARIISSLGKPAGNNVALEMAINTVSGGLIAKVTDAPAEAFTVPYSGTSYGLFDVVYQIDLGGDDDINFFTARVVAIIEKLRDAGTHMKSISIQGALADTYDTLATAVETMSDINVDLVDPVESAAMQFNRHDGLRRRNGDVSDGVGGWNPGPIFYYDNGNEELVITITDDGITAPPENV